MNVEIPMEIHSDEKGYLDRQCPNENCLFEFKVNTQDYLMMKYIVPFVVK